MQKPAHSGKKATIFILWAPGLSKAHRPRRARLRLNYGLFALIKHNNRYSQDRLGRTRMVAGGWISYLHKNAIIFTGHRLYARNGHAARHARRLCSPPARFVGEPTQDAGRRHHAKSDLVAKLFHHRQRLGICARLGPLPASTLACRLWGASGADKGWLRCRAEHGGHDEAPDLRQSRCPTERASCDTEGPPVGWQPPQGPVTTPTMKASMARPVVAHCGAPWTYLGRALRRGASSTSANVVRSHRRRTGASTGGQTPAAAARPPAFAHAGRW